MDTAYPFDHIIVFTNPSSKQADLALKRIAVLQQTFPKIPLQVIEAQATVAATHAKLRAALTQQLKQGHRPVLGVAGGDGTVNTAVQLLAHSATPEAIRETPLVPLGTGNANDLACMLYGKPTHPEQAFQQGKPIPVRPLQCTVTHPDGTTETWVAASYVSFGSIAHGAHELNKPAVRKLAHRRTWYSGAMTDLRAVWAALHAPTFSIRQNGEQQSMRDILIGNGGRVAKYAHMPAHLSRSDLFVVMVQHTWVGRLATPLEAIKAIMGMAPGQLLRDTTFEFETLEPVYAQYDGEPAEVAAGCKVLISHTEQPFFALATKQA